MERTRYVVQMDEPTAIRIIRVLVRVSDIEAATTFYNSVLGLQGHRVSRGRHHYRCGETEFACYDPRADGDLHDMEVTPGHAQIYFGVDDLETTLQRVKSGGGRVHQGIETKPWGEPMFWAGDPFGNRLCFVASRSHS